MSSMPENEHPVRLRHPEWSRSAVIYQVNLRAFTDEGTIAAAEGHLERLARLGVDILWLMPLQEIGQVNRAGALGSPYAIRDYRSVRGELGNAADLKQFVRRAHSLGMHVILDWVANHTARDNVLVVEHPEWYRRDSRGDLVSTPWTEWLDVADLDYTVPELRRYMIETMSWWLREFGLDGFRCDVAGYLPTGFWERARAAFEEVRPVFMLAEWESRDLHDLAFDATYGWSWYEAMRATASGSGTGPLREYYGNNEKSYSRDALRMLFVSNHDKNAWVGTEFEVFGEAASAAIVLTVVSEGIPLVYNGQEAGNPERLPFFEKSAIAWGDHPNGRLYERLIALKHRCAALWNGAAGGRMLDLPNDTPDRVLSFARASDESRVLAVLNLSPTATTVTVDTTGWSGVYSDAITNGDVDVEGAYEVALKGWGFVVFEGTTA